MSSSHKVIGSISEGFNKGEFDWMINICSDEIFETLNPTKSPTFSFESSSWCMKIEKYISSKGDYLSLKLYREDLKNPSPMSLSFNMIILGTVVKKVSGYVLYNDKYQRWGWNEYISRENLLEHWTKVSKKCFQLIIKLEVGDLAPQDALLKIKLKGKDILSQNYKDMLLDGEDHDLVLKVKHKEFKAHRIIMKSRCPVFKSMLAHEMLEKNSGIVDIPDCDPSAFEQFILYIYTGELDTLDESTMLGLYFIADKYDMENLKEECSTFIEKSLSVNVVCDVIKLALDHSDSKLLEFATKYFVNNAEEIFVTLEWMSFMKDNPIQANELIIKTFKKSSDCCVRRLKDDASDLEKK